MHIRLICCCLALSVTLSTVPAVAQDATPEERSGLQHQIDRLNAEISKLPAQRAGSRATREDVEVYAKAGEWILRHKEFFKPAVVKDTQTILQTGLTRAAALAQGQATWGTQPGKTILAYRSQVDGSVQPYALTLPTGFDAKSAQRWPLHVVLHGRGSTLNEVTFIKQHDGKPAPADQTWIQLDVFGRTNNAYRWAGEADVFEAIADVQRRYKIDDRRITLWGFSMGGAGAWHLGLHHPSRWSSVGAGAGFVDFYAYQKKTDKLPDWQDRTLRIYDAVDYALNLADVPFITYGGEIDPQLAASLTMQERAQQVRTPVQVLIGPQMGHKFDDESLKKFMAFHAEHAKQGRPAPPGRREIRFTTCTLKYNSCEWLTILELETQYEPATVESKVDAEGTLVVTTKNVAALSIDRNIADRVRLDDGPAVALTTAADANLPDVFFVRENGGWKALDYQASLSFEENPHHHKRHNLQGPIDDAFMEPFLCVRGTGTAWSQPHQEWASWTLDRFQREFDKWMRGQVPVIDDRQLTDAQIASHNLVLFGDPGSNSVIARVLQDLPVRWTKDDLVVNGKEYDPSTHGVALIYPNPLNPRRYVVINSGMTMHEKDFQSSNAWLFPKLGDIAVLNFAKSKDGYSESIEWAAIFDGQWRLPSTK